MSDLTSKNTRNRRSFGQAEGENSQCGLEPKSCAELAAFVADMPPVSIFFFPFLLAFFNFSLVRVVAIRDRARVASHVNPMESGSIELDLHCVADNGI